MANNSFTAQYDAAKKKQEEEQARLVLPSFTPLALSLPTLEPVVPQRTDNHDLLHQIERETGLNATKEYLAPVQKPRTLWDEIKDFPKLVGEGIRAKAETEANMATDEIIDPLETAGLNLFKGVGAFSAGEAIGAGIGKITGNEDIQKRAREVSDIDDQMLKEAKEQNPLASSIGNLAGNLMLMGGIGQGLGAIKGLGQLPTIARGAITGFGTLAGAEAVHGAGAAATGKITPGEYAKNVGISGIAGAAGGALSAGVNAAGLKLLRGMNKAKSGIITAGSDFIGAQNKVLPNVLLGGASSLGYSAGVTGTQELSKAITDENYTPDWKQIGTNALTAFAFGAFNAYLRTAQTSEANRSTMQQVNDAVQDSYRKWSEATDPAIKAQYAEETAAWADRAIKSLADMQIVGADQQVRDMADFLWNIEQEMAAYTTLNTNFGAELGAGGALVPGMAGGLAPTGGQPAPGTPRGTLPDQTGALAALAVNGNIPAAKAQPEGLTLPTLEPENAQNAKNLPTQGKNLPAQAANLHEGVQNLPTERYSLRDVPVPTYEELVAKPDVTVVDVRRPQTGTFAEERAAFLDGPMAKQMYSAPVVNRDTGEGIFITPATMTHTFSNEGWEQIELAEHLPEIVETAVLTHAEPSRKAPDDRTTGVYTLFGAALTDAGVQPVKLTVKEYNIEKQAIPATIAEYLGTGVQPETYASVYDGKVLVLENIEKESPSSSAATDAAEKAAVYHPSGLSAISVKDLLSLVKGDAARYVPQPESGAVQIMPGSAGAQIQNGGMTNGNEGNAGPQLAGPRGNEAGQNAVGETGTLYRGDAGGRPDELGRGAADAIRIRGGSKENRALTLQRQRAAMEQPLASPADMGIENGSASPSLRVLPEADYDAEASEFTEWAYARGIKDIKIVTGLIQIETPEGPVSVLDVINKDTGTLIIRGDSLKRSLTETGRHSVGHFVTGQAQVETFEQAIKGRYKEEAWGRIFDTYRRSWEPLTNNYAGMTERETELYVWEEILEDAYAGVDNYGQRASVYFSEAQNAIDGAQDIQTPELPALDGAEAGTQPEINGTRGPPDRYSYAGKNAHTADTAALETAERLEMQGLDPEDIRRETGWFRGDDGLWRFEIDDRGMKYRSQGDMAFMQDPEYREYLELWDKVVSRSEGTDEDLDRVRELDKKYSGVGRIATFKLHEGRAKLADIIQHDELFKAYPQLRNVFVQFADLPKGVLGEFDQNRITLDNSLRDAPEDTLIHEIQHAIQRAEGFARGANREYWQRRLDNGFDNRTRDELRHAEDLERQYDVMEKSDPAFMREAEALYATVPDLPRGKVDWDTLEQIEEDPPEWQEFDAKRDALEERYGWEKIGQFFDLKYGMEKARSGKRGAYDLYRDTAGEIEARDAAKRREWTPEKRRETPPTLGGGNAVFNTSDFEEFAQEQAPSKLEKYKQQLAEIEKRMEGYDPFRASMEEAREHWKYEDKQKRLIRMIDKLEHPDQEGAPPIETRAFKTWFGDWTEGKGSKVVDENGRPLIVYHGTGTSIEAFDPAFTGKGNDQYGAGFYFTTDRKTAERYTTATINGQPKLGGDDNPNVIPVYLNIRHPIVLDASETPNLYDFPISAAKARQIIAGHPKIMDPEESILGDFIEEYWETGPKKWMIDKLAREYDWTLGSLETDLFSGYPEEFHKAVKAATGYDGVQANFKSGERHYIAWFPNQIKHATENNGAYSRNDNRIRYSVDSEQPAEYNALMERDDVLLGDQDDTFTEANRTVPFTYAIVPGDSLIISNDEYGNVNPKYPQELQPRDRTRTASQEWTADTSKNLNPRKLAESATAQNGAPIVRGDGVVIGGNGRSRSILMAYASGNAGEYEQFLQEKGGRYGIDTANLPDKPILVRIARDVDDWPALAEELNVSSQAAYSATERAMSDARKMEGVLELLIPNDDGDINTAANAAFIQAFIQKVVPKNEQGDVLDGPGHLSQKGLERVENAIFAYAYGDPNLLQKYSESLDNDMKNVTNALMQSAPAAVALQADIKAGRAYDLPAVQTILKAMEIFAEAKRGKKTVEEQANQLSLLEPENEDAGELAMFIDRNKRSAKQMRIAFNSLYEEIESYGDPNQESFFGGEEHDIHGALEGAVKRYEQATGREFGRPDYWGAGMDAGMGSETAAPGAGAGSEPNDESIGRSGAEDAGADGGELPESEPGELTLPKLEEEPKPAKAQKAPKEPKPRKERAPTRRKPPEPIPSTLPENGIPEGYNSIEEFVASSTARAEAAKAERLRNVSKDDFVGTPALQKIGVKIDNSVGIYSHLRQLMENDRAAKQIQRETHRAERRLGATDGERNFASGIAAGVYSASDIPASMNRDKVMELADYYWAEQAVADDRIRKQREQIGRALEEKMEELFRDSDEFKPSKAIVLNYRTPQRNMLHIFGDERGKAINEALFDPVAVNEAERFRFVNRMHDEVRTFAGEDGKQRKLTKEERALVQMLIEGKAVAEEVASMEMHGAIENVAHNIRNGGDAGDSAKEFGLSREEEKLAVKYARWLQTDEALHSGKVDAVKVENAAKKYSELFDQFYDAINDFLVAHGYEPIGFIKGYAPHIQPENNQNLLNKALNTLGINTDVTRLPSSIAGLTANYKPNKRWNPYFLSRTSDVTDYDIASAFESYVDYMSDVLYHTDDIMRIRQAAKYFRQTYAPEEIKNNLSWANELRYGTAEQKANYLRDQGVIDRSAVLSPADINAQMDEYVEKLFGDITKTTKYSDLVMWLDNYANILAGKQSAADRAPESMWGREVLNIGNKLVRTFAQANVAGNLSSMLNQTAQIPMIQAELGSRWTAAAIKDILTGKLRRAEWASQSDFLTGKKGIEYLVSTPGEMVLTALFKPAEIMDTFVSTVAVRGKYLKELHAGKSPKEAMKAADAFGTAVMGSRMKGSKPLAFNSKNPIYQMVNIFQIEALNSWEHVKEDLPRDFRTIEKEQGKGKAALALAGVIVKALLLTFLMNRLAEKTYGGTPAPFDLLGMTANFIASGNGLTTNAYLETLIDNAWEKISGERLFGTEDHIGEEPFDYETALKDLGYNVSNDIPFLRNAAGLLGLGDQTLPMPDIIGNAWNIGKGIYNNGLTLDTGRGALKMLSELIPGGKQLYKTALGLETIMRGGDFSGKIDNEKLKYPTEDDFWSTVQSLMFGKYATEASDEYYASGASELSADQTRLWRSLTEGGADPGETYDAIQSYRKIANDEDLTSYEKGVQERALIRDLDMTDDQKLEMYRELSNADSRAEKFRTIMDTGLSFAQTISAYDKYAEIDADEGKKATEKATAFSKWIDQQGYKSSQAKAIKEELKFWNIIPADATRYEKLTDAGLETEDAFKLTNALADLKPEPGKENVSDMQKYRVIDSSNLSDREKIAAVGTIMGTDMTTESGNPSQYAKMQELLDDGVTLGQFLDLSEADAVDGYLRYEGVNVGRDYGITPETYMDYKERLPSFDADKNGSYKQEEIEAALDSMGGGPTLPSLGGKRDATLTNTQRAVLWQLANKSWKPKNNPYDTTVGQWVYDALHAEPEENNLPILRGGTGDLPGLS